MDIIIFGGGFGGFGFGFGDYAVYTITLIEGPFDGQKATTEKAGGLPPVIGVFRCDRCPELHAGEVEQVLANEFEAARYRVEDAEKLIYKYDPDVIEPEPLVVEERDLIPA